jgi:hypothetical protein
VPALLDDDTLRGGEAAAAPPALRAGSDEQLARAADPQLDRATVTSSMPGLDRCTLAGSAWLLAALERRQQAADAQRFPAQPSDRVVPRPSPG